MPSVNKVTLMGYLARDPELRYTPQGSAVCDFAIGMNRRYKRKENGELVDEVTFVEVTVWNRTAEVCAEYLKKGRLLWLAGSLKQERWDDKESGEKRSRLKVVAQDVVFLGKTTEDEEPGAVVEEESAPAELPPPKAANGAAPSRPKR